MNRVFYCASVLLGGLLVTAPSALPQGYTISARPGGINYIEGHVFVNNRPLSDKALRTAFLGANDTLSTELGKAEMLLTPGVYLRLGDNSAVKMVAPSLTDTQVEVTRGEAMLEAAGLLKDNNVIILDRGATVKIEKNGLYRFVASDPPTVAVLDGKAEVAFNGHTVQLGKDHETTLDAALKSEKFDKKRPDELYAWSNVRSEYNAASSYQTARNVATTSDPWWSFGYGLTGAYGAGWLWDSSFGNWAWIPAYGAFYSPFGYGFYAPGAVAYAPVVVASVPVTRNGAVATKIPARVPVNPVHPPAVGAIVNSPATLQAARVQTARAYSYSGFSTASGARIASGGGGGGWAGRASSGGVASSSAGRASSGGFSGGGFSGGHAASAGGGISGSHR